MWLALDSMGDHLFSVPIISGVSCSSLPWCTPTLIAVLWLIPNNIMPFSCTIPDFYVPWGNCWQVMFLCASFPLFALSWYLKLPLKANLEGGNFQRHSHRKFQFLSSSSLFSSFPVVKEISTLPEAKLWEQKAGAKAAQMSYSMIVHGSSSPRRGCWPAEPEVLDCPPFSCSY